MTSEKKGGKKADITQSLAVFTWLTKYLNEMATLVQQLCCLIVKYPISNLFVVVKC